MLIRSPHVFLHLLLREMLAQPLHQKPHATYSAPASTPEERARQSPLHLMKHALELPPVRLCSSSSQAAGLRLAACTALRIDARAVQTPWHAVVLLVSPLGGMLAQLTTPTVIRPHVWLVLLACLAMTGLAPNAARLSGRKQNPASLAARSLLPSLCVRR